MSNELNHILAAAAKGKISRREFVGQAGAMGVSAAMAGTMLATAARAEGPVKGGVIRAGVQGGQSTDSLDPALAASDVPFMVNSTWGETLVDVELNGTLGMRVAEEVSSNADATQWMFKIRKGVEYHNGATLTAEDVIATLKRHTDDNSKSGAQGIVKGITDMKAEGDMVTLTLNAGNADLPFLMADYHLMIQPGGGMDNPSAGIGSGPYKITANEPGVRTAFEKHANYWDAERGHADQVEVLSINDNTARTAAIQSGQIQMMSRVDPKIVELLAGNTDVVIERAAGPGHYVFIMECNKAPYDNNDLRMALKLAVNRQELVDKILGGMGSVGNDFPINAAYPLFDDTIPQREYDAAKAAEYYKKSGHDGSPLILQVAPSAFPGAVEAAQLFQASANAAGIPLQVKLEPDDGYWSNVWNVAPFCASYWGGRPVQDQMYSTAYLSTADWNDTKFVDKHFDELMIAARGELDQTKRKAMYSEMANILRDTGGLICPMFNDWVEGRRQELGGWVANPAGTLMNGKALSMCWLNAEARMHPILKLVVQRIALGLLLLLAVSFVIFLGVQMLPGDTAQAILGQSATPVALANLRHELGLDQPALSRYLTWLGHALQGDLGKALTNGQDISQAIGQRFGNTLFLASCAGIIAVPLAITLGLIAARYNGRWPDKLISGITLATISLPEFVAAYFVIYLLTQVVHLFQPVSMVFPGMTFWQRLNAVSLPVIVLVMVVLAHMMRMTRAAILNVMQSAYIETAELKGLSPMQVIWHHALPNAIAPIIAVVVINLAYLVVGVVVVEVVFSYNALGQYLVDHVAKRDLPVVQAVGIIFAAVYIGLNILADVIGIVANPRLRHPK